MNGLPQLQSIEAAIDSLAQLLVSVDSEFIAVGDAAGRVLSEPLILDRDSPPIDVSAMDGYAVRVADVVSAEMPVAGTSCAGSPPMKLPDGSAIRIFTGAPIPIGADCVVKREDTLELDQRVRIELPIDRIKPRQNIRYQGENGNIGGVALVSGTELAAPAMASVATFGRGKLQVRRRLRVAVLNTGDELIPAGEPASAWQIRDSNGPLLEAWLRRTPWIDFQGRWQARDSFDGIRAAVEERLKSVDTLILTGGVSMGDTDFVPKAIDSVGGKIVFHRLPIRPGKPVLGAVLDGKLVVGLPGNPVSVAVTSRVIAAPLLRRQAGIQADCPTSVLTHIANPDDRTLPLVWYRLVSIGLDGQVRLIESRGSGDLISLSQSHGFVELPPGGSGPGPWKLTIW